MKTANVHESNVQNGLTFIFSSDKQLSKVCYKFLKSIGNVKISSEDCSNDHEG